MILDGDSDMIDILPGLKSEDSLMSLRQHKELGHQRLRIEDGGWRIYPINPPSAIERGSSIPAAGSGVKKNHGLSARRGSPRRFLYLRKLTAGVLETQEVL